MNSSSSIPTTGATPNPFAYPKKQRVTQTRVLPRQNERSVVTVLLGRNLNLKLEVYALLSDRPKNEIVLQALNGFLEQRLSCELGHASVLPANAKKRITFILTRETDAKVESAVHSGAACSKSCLLTSAIVFFLQNEGIDPHSELTTSLRAALHQPVTVSF